MMARLCSATRARPKSSSVLHQRSVPCVRSSAVPPASIATTWYSRLPRVFTPYRSTVSLSESIFWPCESLSIEDVKLKMLRYGRPTHTSPFLNERTVRPVLVSGSNDSMPTCSPARPESALASRIFGPMPGSNCTSFSGMVNVRSVTVTWEYRSRNGRVSPSSVRTPSFGSTEATSMTPFWTNTKCTASPTKYAVLIGYANVHVCHACCRRSSPPHRYWYTITEWRLRSCPNTTQDATELLAAKWQRPAMYLGRWSVAWFEMY